MNPGMDLHELGRRWFVPLLLWGFAGLLQAQPEESLRVVGGLANLNQYVRHERPFWTDTLKRLSAGKLKAEIIPFDEAGLTPVDLLRAVQADSVSIGTVLLSQAASLEPQLAGPDLTGLNPDFAAAQRSLSAYRPYLARLLQERHGVRLLAVYAYPAQVVFCAKPFDGLAALKGRRIRVSSQPQAVFLAALGAQPVQMAFGQMVPAMKGGSIDCAVTGTMTGNTIGLVDVSSHMHDMPLSWGLAMVVANEGRWRQLSMAKRQLIEREMPRLEAAIWQESGEETDDGLACNSGSATCRNGRKAQVVRVATSAADRALNRDLLRQHVVPAWLQRCGEACQPLWRKVLAPTAGLEVP
jgi:TRAP-type C4-dicarboxylate transport system substrate-binding protein